MGNVFGVATTGVGFGYRHGKAGPDVEVGVGVIKKSLFNIGALTPDGYLGVSIDENIGSGGKAPDLRAPIGLSGFGVLPYFGYGVVAVTPGFDLDQKTYHTGVAAGAFYSFAFGMGLVVEMPDVKNPGDISVKAMMALTFP